MNKEDRDQLRKVLAFHPGELVPLPGTNTIIELLDQIDELEKECLELVCARFALAHNSNRLMNVVKVLFP